MLAQSQYVRCGQLEPVDVLYVHVPSAYPMAAQRTIFKSVRIEIYYTERRMHIIYI